VRTSRFADRVEAGRLLADALASFSGPDTVVVGLPRGGVPVAAEIARALGAPLDVLLVRKLGVPFQPELAMGAIGEDGGRILNDDVIGLTGVTRAEIDEVEERERAELERRLTRYRKGRRAVPLGNKTVIVVDDGMATGATARAALSCVRHRGPRRIVLALPVAPADVDETIGDLADDIVVLRRELLMGSVGAWYRDFSPTSDAEVVDLLTGSDAGHEAMVVDELEVPLDDIYLTATLSIPSGPTGLVVFAHGSGSSRFSPRNRQVANRLNERGLGTVLLDLLTPAEEPDRTMVFDVVALGRRLHGCARWVAAQPWSAGLPIGYFGASTGAAAALWAAAEPDSTVSAIVSRGGRPDLAGERLSRVTVPTLLIVGESDLEVWRLNSMAAAGLTGVNEVAVVPRATHLFEEPGALEAVADLACDWFEMHLRSTSPELEMRG
jgi:putative phosphoribosyl transferase